jgi:3-polyprenyl-4-hydroxybenzoate decarboxylase
MGYRSLRECLADLERTKQLVRVEAEVDAHLESAEIQRRVYQARGSGTGAALHACEGLPLSHGQQPVRYA